MTGRGVKWTDERRAAKAEEMRLRNADPAFAAKRIAAVKASEFNRLTKRTQMKALIWRRDNDPDMNEKWRAALKAANGRPERLIQLEHARAVKNARIRDPDVFNDPLNLAKRKRRAAKAVATRRGYEVPLGLIPLFNDIRPKVGLEEAVRLVKREAARMGYPT